jgi:hypothetical protein
MFSQFFIDYKKDQSLGIHKFGGVLYEALDEK